MRLNLQNTVVFALDQMAWLLVILFYASFMALKPGAMLSFDTGWFILYSSIPLGFLVVAESIPLITGNFDLSIGQATGLVAMATGYILMRNPGLNPVLAFVMPFAFGALCGTLNGFLVGILNLNPFLSTLGTFLLFDGLTLIIHPQSIWGIDLPKYYTVFGGTEYVAILFFLASLVILGLTLKYTRVGIHIYATGGDKESAAMLGIRTNRVVFLAYTLAGFFSGASALMYIGFVNGVPMNLADSSIFSAFAGAVIGGISITGGTGSVINSFAGCLVVGILEAGLTMFAISPELRKASEGVLVIFAILLDRVRINYRDRLLRPQQ
jgi:ribose/xylose/arabinose/galactoside ABC-type transport system permease subunit